MRLPALRDPAWTRLETAGVDARAFRVWRRDIAFWKHLFESYEGVAILRTVAKLDDERAIIALLATPDMAPEADAILASLAEGSAPDFEVETLPAVCREDWFLATWGRAE
ncbi:MAG: DUF4911 domain-containing protein [Deltaproteobacteria bacterium]